MSVEVDVSLQATKRQQPQPRERWRDALQTADNSACKVNYEAVNYIEPCPGNILQKNLEAETPEQTPKNPKKS